MVIWVPPKVSWSKIEKPVHVNAASKYCHLVLTPLALVSAASCRHWAIHSEGKLFVSLRSGGWQTVCHRWRRPLATARREPSDERVAPSGLDELLWCPVPAEGSNGKSTSQVWQQPPTRALSGTLQTWPSTVASDCVGKSCLSWQRYRGWHAVLPLCRPS